MHKLTLVAAFGAGYVLGARAGRDRYETIRRAVTRVKDDPRTQQAMHSAAETAKEQAPMVKDKLTDAASAAVDKVKPSKSNGSTSTPSTTSSSSARAGATA